MQRQFGDNCAKLHKSEYMAIDGRIGITNTETGHYSVISLTEAKEKFSELVQDFRRLESKFPRDYKPVYQFLDDMKKVMRDAEKQGPPEAQDILQERVRRRKLQIRPSGLILPS